MRVELGPSAWVELPAGESAVVSWPYGHRRCDDVESLVVAIAQYVHDREAECVPLRRVAKLKQEEYNRGYRHGYGDRSKNLRHDPSTATA